MDVVLFSKLTLIQFSRCVVVFLSSLSRLVICCLLLVHGIQAMMCGQGAGSHPAGRAAGTRGRIQVAGAFLPMFVFAYSQFRGMNL